MLLVSAEIPFYLLFTNIMLLLALIWTTLSVIFLYPSFLCNRLKLQRICMSGKLLLKVLCLKHLVQLSQWERMDSSRVMLLMCLKGLLDNVWSSCHFMFCTNQFPNGCMVFSINFLVNYVEMLLTDQVANPECEMFMRKCITFRSEHVHSLGCLPLYEHA